jgi:hypothetical protein
MYGPMSPPACRWCVRGKLAHTAEPGSITGICSVSAKSVSASMPPASRPAVSVTITGFRAPASSPRTAPTSSGALTVVPLAATGFGSRPSHGWSRTSSGTLR